jgi:hypothetical protein
VLEPLLQRLEAELRRRARISLCAGLFVALFFGGGMQLVAWTSNGGFGERATLSVLFAAISLGPALLFMRPALSSKPSLLTRLRAHPDQLRRLELQWIDAPMPRGRLWFQFRDGFCYEWRLPVKDAREAYAVLGSSYARALSPHA